MHKGSCLCGAISFEVSGDLPAPTACHCTQCRKHTGHYEAGTDVPRCALSIKGEDKITWYSTQKARRGFCSLCGSSLFFNPIDKDWVGISMGAFDTPTHTKLRLHVFVQNKGDYYELSDGVPEYRPKG